MAAAAMDFTPGYGRFLQQLEIDQQVDPIAIAMALLAAARQFAPFGRRIGSALLKRMVGGTSANFEDLVEQVDWKEPEQETPTDSSATLKPEPRKLEPELADIKLTPEQKQQKQQI